MLSYMKETMNKIKEENYYLPKVHDDTYKQTNKH